ncbi:hypothetical protein G4B88_004860 [Cannabis sativa]|uniref:RING-type domain-containing protein n=1 Tax=Cannabis sativa TaxID=3483 RepID=A0A7J6FVB1_CANSA|nr:hypothetical protein G4B88_004860 [Cannabis sativa]
MSLECQRRALAFEELRVGFVMNSTESEEGNMSRNGTSLNLDLNNFPPSEEIQDQGNGHFQSQEQQAPTTNGVVVASTENVVILSPSKYRETYFRRRRNGVEIPRTAYEISQLSSRIYPNDPRCFRMEVGQNIEEFNKTQNVATDIPVAPPSPQTIPVVVSPSFICGICMDQLTEETSTKCGHIFCKICIETAIATQKKCPTCRQKLKKRDTIRVYLPTSS